LNYLSTLKNNHSVDVFKRKNMTYFQTFIFAITLAISIGPIAILILNQSINCGLKNGIWCGLGAASADFTYAIITFTAGSILFPFIESQKKNIPLISSSVLILFSLWMIYSTIRKRSSDNNKKYSLTCKSPYLTTYGLTVSNPLTIIVFSGFSGMMTSEGHGPVYVYAIIIFVTSLSVQLLIAFIGSKLARFFSDQKTLLYFNLASACGIMLLGVSKLI
jgi:threonine/homoserine/homoserine lactone efflux protein